ncbi:MAG: hypothetical protein EDX89_01215 [Acidobacteria bacterium]|nr:MAG: hypothetical protein EDX89_01215 [Acidobacteriota bacterium]
MPERRRHRGEAVVVTTVSDDGVPHHAFLSEDEWGHREDGRVAMALLSRSRTAGNLRARRVASLLSLSGRAPGTAVLRLAGRPRRLRADADRHLFTFDVLREIPARTLPGEAARLVGTLAYERREDPEEARRRRLVEEEILR